MNLKSTAMKNNSNWRGFWLGLVISSQFLIQCKGPLNVIQIVHQKYGITQTQHFIPVITGVYNEVLELSLDLSTEQELKEIQVSLKGEEALEGIQVHQLVGEGEEMQKIPIAAISGAEAINIIQVRKALPAGRHRFMISIIPKAEATLLKKITVDISKIELGNKHIRPI